MFGADFDLKTFNSLSERDKQLMSRKVYLQVAQTFEDVGIAVEPKKPGSRKAIADLAADLPVTAQAALLQCVDAYIAKSDELGYRHHFGSPEKQGLMHTLQMQARELGVPDDHPLGKHLARALEAATQLANLITEEEQIAERQKAKGVTGADSLHNIGLPGAVDKRLAEQVLSTDFESKMVQAYTGLLTPQEISKAVDRLHVVQEHLRGLEAAGRLLNDDEWTAERTDRQGVRLDEIQRDPRHNHISRMKDRYEQNLADEAEKQARIAAKAAKVAAQAAAAAVAASVAPSGPAAAA